MKKVVIVGGGLSGLAAGVKLTGAGYGVQILEQGSQAGGRTYSFREKQSGNILDNGQHILLDCYKHTLQYVSTIGANKLIASDPELNLTFVHADWGTARVHISRKLPPRAALIRGLSGYSFLSFTDRMRLLKVGHKLFTSDENYYREIRNLTVEEWLKKTKQSDKVKRCFWYPLAIAIMNEAPDRASAEVFVRTMKLGVFDEHGPASIITPLRGLSDVFVKPAVTYISKHGGRVDCNKRVTGMHNNGESISSVVMQNNAGVQGDAFIITGQPVHMQSFLNEAGVGFGSNSAIDYVPIITCNIWFDKEPVMPARVGMIDTAFHWVFKKEPSFTESEGEGYVSMVMSGARNHVGIEGEQLMKTALEELRACFPDIRDANVKYYRIIKERRATVSITPEVQKNRPDAETRFNNLFIAGDWTQTQLPATIEGAIMSGFRAADRVMDSL